MMLRLRRYRVFVVVAIIATFSLYHLAQIRSLDTRSIGVDKLKNFGHQVVATSSVALPLTTKVTSSGNVRAQATAVYVSTTSPSPTSSTHQSTLLDIPDVSPTSTTVQGSSPTQTTALRKGDERLDETQRTSDEEEIPEAFGSGGHGRFEIDEQTALLEKSHWKPQKEHFPVDPDSMIQLPTGKPKKIPAIQHDFRTETPIAKQNREQKLKAVLEAFKHAWSGYRKYAMPHDELVPVSKDFRNPFNGWGATLVDTLDTLWIMGLKDEFGEAVAEVKTIDFTTSIRKDIPLFETVIRYLGGLVAAYDLSAGQYPILLDKAVQLAEILIGAFDTPNRMPVTYYHWAPSYASQPHRASSKVVLAELGSLSLEFTRLAQITKDPRFYDAVARITNELETWQNKTKIPGLWPVSVDVSGCKKPDRLSAQMAHSAANGPQHLLPPTQRSPTMIVDKIRSDEKVEEEKVANLSDTRLLDKRQLDDAGFSNHQGLSNDEEPAISPSDQLAKSKGDAASLETFQKASNLRMDGVDCQPQGLASPPLSSTETFTLGGMSDSTYEYLPKEWLLLGGLNDQYESMYKYAMDAVRDRLLFRPMTKDGRDVLFVGAMKESKIPEGKEHVKTLGEGMQYEGQHLTCFAGGMFAIGARIFGIKGDLEIAQKLTDGCVWAYESTATGIMPEVFHLVPCPYRDDCAWNETRWWEALDPYRESREEQAKTWYEHQKLLGQLDPAADDVERPERPQKTTSAPLPRLDANAEDSARFVKRDPGAAHSRSEDIFEEADRDEKERVEEEGEPWKQPTKIQSKSTENQAFAEIPFATHAASPVFTPKPPASHEDFVQARIKEERLPPGFAGIDNKKYILRPEAIESVFIMYRVTGNKYWQDAGWEMFNAIQTHTLTEHGNSAIMDVTSKAPLFTDEMESFWLAETLKYFYLLYSEPSVVSLDDYVL
jgi:mannosyl-oligosaccharide alpha-1,2-mannosidase